MLNILRCKFTQYPDLKKALLDTDDAHIIEHTPVKRRDAYWADDYDGTGKNNLGLCLMTVRQELGGKPPNPECLKKLSGMYKYLNS